MTVVIARDATATDHLVYAWPFPLGPEEIEVSCGEDEIVVMCPSWLVGDRLGPGRHRWRTPDPTRPVGAYFVSTAPVETSFDVTTSFVIPATQQTATLRAQGSIIVRCVDPGLLIAQFVGLPFDNVNEGLLRSVTRSSERLVARVLTRRTVMGQTVAAVTDPGMLPSIIEELIAYNPAAGAVFGVEFVRLTGLYITTGDAGWTTNQLPASPDWSNVDAQGSAPRHIPTEPTKQGTGIAIVTSKPDGGIVSGEIGTPPTAPTAPIQASGVGLGGPREDITTPGMTPASAPGLVPPPPEPSAGPEATAGDAKPGDGKPGDGKPADAKAKADKGAKKDNLRSTLNAAAAVPAPDKRQGSNPSLNPTPSTPPPVPGPRNAHRITEPPPLGGASATPPPPAPMPLPPITPPMAASGAIEGRKGKPTLPSVVPPPGASSSPNLSPSLAAITPRPKSPSAPPPVPPVPPVPKPEDKDTTKLKQKGGGTPIAKPGGPTPSDGVPLPVMGIGMGGIGVGGGRVGESSQPTPITSEDEKAVQGEIHEKLDKGSRVLVPGADGRLVSATIRQEQSGYYELEIGGSGETLWVPRANVVADK